MNLLCDVQKIPGRALACTGCVPGMEESSVSIQLSATSVFKIRYLILVGHAGEGSTQTRWDAWEGCEASQVWICGLTRERGGSS